MDVYSPSYGNKGFDPSLTMNHQGWGGRSALESPTEKEPLPRKKTVQQWVNLNISQCFHQLNIVKHSGNIVKHSGNIVKHCGNIVKYCGNIVKHSGNIVKHSANIVKHSGNIVKHSGNIVKHS